MDETSKKTLFEQKLADPNTTLESLMANDLFLESFRSGNPQLLSLYFLSIIQPEDLALSKADNVCDCGRTGIGQTAELPVPSTRLRRLLDGRVPNCDRCAILSQLRSQELGAHLLDPGLLQNNPQLHFVGVRDQDHRQPLLQPPFQDPGVRDQGRIRAPDAQISRVKECGGVPDQADSDRG